MTSPSYPFTEHDLLAGRYRIVRFVAAGVYEADDLETGERVAIKTTRVEVEAHDVMHPNVARVFGTGEHEGTRFVVMELLRGTTLARHLRERTQLSTDDALPIVRQVCDGLAAAHRAGVVHGELTSESILLADGRVVVTDFGLASAGVVAAAYAAPEQRASQAADIYALGVILFEMVTGARPQRGAMTSPRQYAPELDARWEAAILACLERDPRDRFASATEVVDALTGEAPVRMRSAQRNRGALAAAGVLMVIAVAGGILQHRAAREELQHPPAPRTFRIVPRTSVAVAEFRNASGERDADWMSTALGELLTNELAAGGRLRVIPGEERNLGADAIVSGSYETLDDEQLRVDVRVQKAGITTQLVEQGNVADIAAKIGKQIREALGVQIAAPPPVAIPKLYAEGLAALRRFDAVAARDVLERAVLKDPEDPRIHAALAQAWAALGHDAKARESAKRAFELSTKLPREQRLLVEASYRELTGDWERAQDIYRALTSYFPDNIDYVLRLANAQTKHGDANDALATVAYLRRFPAPLGNDPRIDLAEAEAASALANYPRMQQAAERAMAKAEQRDARLLVARAMSAQGIALHQQGRTREGIEAQQRAIAIWRNAGDRHTEARTLFRIGAINLFVGDIPAARRYFTDALAIAGETGDAWVQSAAWNNLAYCAFLDGDPRGAEPFLRRVHALTQELDDRRAHAASIDSIGYAQYLRGELDDAEQSFSDSLALASSIGSQHVIAAAKTNLGDVLLARGDTARARQQYESALATRDKIGDRRGVTESRIAIANVSVEDGRAADAEALARTAATWSVGAKVWDAEALARNALARALLLQGRVGDARREIDAAAALVAQHQNVLVAITVTATRARVAAAEGNAVDAQQYANDAVRLASNGGLVLPRLEAELARAEVADARERRAMLEAVRRGAAARGFTLIERKARA